MKIQMQRLGAAAGSAALLALAGCGSGDGGDASAAVQPPAAPSTTSVTTTVIDGALGNALVCMDKNGNGACDSDEVQGRTAADGSVTLAVPTGDVGKVALLAVVDTDAVDAVSGKVAVKYTLAAPADKSAVISPLTTLVQHAVASAGLGSADAAKALQDAAGLTASPFDDYTKATPVADGRTDAATLARMLVLATQQQQTAIAAALGSNAIDGKPITQADLDKAIRKTLLDLMPSLVSAVADPAVLAAADAAAREAALLAAAAALVTRSGIAPAAVATVVAVNKQPPASGQAAAPTAGSQLTSLSFTDAANYNMRVLTASLAQATPDAANMTRYVDRRYRSVAGNLAKWGSGSDPWRNADLHWTGSAWAACALNFENTSTVRDAAGNSSYTYCGTLEAGKSSRATLDIGGKTMAEVLAQATAAGYTNLDVTNSAALGSTTFPSGSQIFYQTNTPLSRAIAYYPSGPDNPPGLGNVVTQYSAAVSGGGMASAQPAGTACNATETQGSGSAATTLEGMVAAKPGTPCIYGEGSFVYGGVTYKSGPQNEWWSNSTVSLGKIGSAPVNSGTAPGFYTGNTLLRIAFQGSGSNPVTYYACQERFNNGSTRNCKAIGSGSYTIQTLGDARAMTFSNPPAQAAALGHNRVFVERGGFVYSGYQSKLQPSDSVRLNTTATKALLAQLGITAEDPEVPLALTAASYQGNWDLREAGKAVSATDGIAVFISANGGVSCVQRDDGSAFACSVVIDPATGAFSFSGDTTTASGSFDFMAGTAAGTFHDPTSTPADGSFVGGRR